MEFSTPGLSKAEMDFNFPVGGMQPQRSTAAPPDFSGCFTASIALHHWLSKQTDVPVKSSSLEAHQEDWYFNVDHFKSSCYFNKGNAGGSYCNVDTFENRCYYIDYNFEDEFCLNDGNTEGCYINVDQEEDCYFTTDQGAEEAPGAYREASTTTLVIKDQLLPL